MYDQIHGIASVFNYSVTILEAGHRQQWLQGSVPRRYSTSQMTSSDAALLPSNPCQQEFPAIRPYPSSEICAREERRKTRERRRNCR